MITARRKGTARIRVLDPVRGLAIGPNRAARVVVSGKLKQLKIDPEPFRVGAGETRRPRVFGVLTGGLATGDLRELVEWSIDDPTIARLQTEGGDTGRVEGLKVGTTTLRARDPKSGIATTSTGNLVVRGRVTSVTAEPTSVVLGRGLPFALRAYANRDDGTRSNVSSSAEWSASPAGIVSVEDGLLRGIADGEATVTATDERTGLSATVSVKVAGTPTALNVAPNPFNVDVAETRKARAIAKLSSGLDSSDLRAVVDWSVADASVGRVGTGEPSEEEPQLDRGEALGIRTGRTTLQAFEPLTGLRSTQTDNLRVGQPGGGGPRPTPGPGGGGRRLVSVVIEVTSGGDVRVGDTINYKARGTYSDGETDNISNDCEWSVDDPSVASVDNVRPGKGEITGLSADESTTVRVTCEGLQASAPVAVFDDIAQLRVDPKVVTGAVLDTIQMEAVAIYSNGGVRDFTDQVFWFSTDEGVATVDNAGTPGLVTLLAEGEALIAATTEFGQSDFAVVLVVGGSVASLRVTGDASALGSTSGEMHAFALLPDGSERNVDHLVEWSSSDDEVVRFAGRAGLSGRIVGGTRPGAATVTATWPGGPSASLATRVTAVLESLWMRDSSRELEVGERLRVSVRGRFSDGRERDLSRSVVLSSSDPDVVRVLADVGKPARVKAVAPGSATITAVDPTTGLAAPRELAISVRD
jgi:uncharacterized protein YjdB